MIKYLGSKRTLLPVIVRAVDDATQDVWGKSSERRACTVLDAFSGTARVGHALKAAGYRVVSNDHNAYAQTLATCYVQADAEDVASDATKLVREFNALKGVPGYFTHTFCERARFFQPKNGERVDVIREAIARKGLPAELEAVMLVALMEAADRVDSTTGVQMAYLKGWAPRSFNDLELRVPDVLPRPETGKCQAIGEEAVDAVRSTEADVVYIDPPYNQHSYLGNYHIWESLVRWDKPEVYGVACKRMDVRERGSAFNSKRQCVAALRAVLGAVRGSVVIVSFSNEGFVSRVEMEELLAQQWGGEARVRTIENDFKRYVGAQIGIHNPQGEKVGKVSHLRNKEYLYVVNRETAAERPDSQARSR